MIDMKKKAEDILEDYTYSYSQIDLETLAKLLDQIRIEAIKEFAERLRKEKQFNSGVIPWYEIQEIINNLVKEMVGDE